MTGRGSWEVQSPHGGLGAWRRPIKCGNGEIATLGRFSIKRKPLIIASDPRVKEPAGPRNDG